MTKVFNDVDVFMRAAGQTIPVEPVPENELSMLYRKLISEEFYEFVEACSNNDSVEQLDACFDMIWVIIGYMHSRGWNCETSWDEGSWSNLSKIDPNTRTVIKRADGKVLKPANWQPPNFKKFV